MRERALRSEAAWRAMANRLQVVQTTRKAIMRERQDDTLSGSGGAPPKVDWPKPG